MQQAADFLDEAEALHAVVRDLPEGDFTRATQFKGWTVDQILQHLHFFDGMARLSLHEPDRFRAEYGVFNEAYQAEGSMLGITDRLLQGLSGPMLLDAWRAGARETAEAFGDADPKQRVPWAGPEMSARSSVTARLMETWAHGQAIYDLLGLERQDHDRIRNIAHMGVAAYGWTFANRGETPPEPMPHVRLDAPSGDVWEWGEPNTDERITGPAVAFCQVVTQTRNIADVGLDVSGPNATRWMANAQCFAGPPTDPPAPGTRHRL